jgi:hypothetical protein
MLRILLISASFVAASGLAVAQETAPAKPIQLAQACGWYAIMHCGSPASARQFVARTGAGRIINTSREAYPNFQPGYFCVVQGPMDRGTALSIAASWRSAGYSPTAYAKNAC